MSKTVKVQAIRGFMVTVGGKPTPITPGQVVEMSEIQARVVIGNNKATAYAGPAPADDADQSAGKRGK